MDQEQIELLGKEQKLKFCRDCGSPVDKKYICTKCNKCTAAFDAVPRHPRQICRCGELVLVNRKYCEYCGELLPEPIVSLIIAAESKPQKMKKKVKRKEIEFPFDDYFDFWYWLKGRVNKRHERRLMEALDFTTARKIAGIAGADTEKEDLLTDYVEKYGAQGSILYFRNEVRKEPVIQPVTEKTGAKVFRESFYTCPVCGKTENIVGVSTETKDKALARRCRESGEDTVKSNWLLLFKGIDFKKELQLSRDMIKQTRSNPDRPKDIDQVDDMGLIRVNYSYCLKHIQEHKFWQKAVTLWLTKNLLPLRYKLGNRLPTKGGKF